MGITIREITDRAGLGYATFYRHYPTKGALLDDVAAAQIRNLVALSLPVLHASNAREACLATVRHVEQHRSLWSALLTGGAASKVREEFLLFAREMNRDRPTTPGDLPADIACRFAASALVEVLTWWLEHVDAVNPADAAQLLKRLVATPLLGLSR